MASRGGSKQADLSSDVFDVLPPPYALALRLDAAGASADELARRLKVSAEAVPLVLEVARRKLRRAAASPDADA